MFIKWRRNWFIFANQKRNFCFWRDRRERVVFTLVLWEIYSFIRLFNHYVTFGFKYVIFFLFMSEEGYSFWNNRKSVIHFEVKVLEVWQYKYLPFKKDVNCERVHYNSLGTIWCAKIRLQFLLSLSLSLWLIFVATIPHILFSINIKMNRNCFSYMSANRRNNIVKVRFQS